jgi:hypothetical protein
MIPNSRRVAANPPAILHAGWLSDLWLDPDPVVDCGPDALLVAEVTLDRIFPFARKRISGEGGRSA